MARLYLVLFFIQIALAAAALISCLSAEESEVNAVPRLWWILIILFFPLVGSIAWFATGRTRATPRTVWPAPGGMSRPQPKRPLAPDDDPEFLRSLNLKPKPKPTPKPQPESKPEPKPEPAAEPKPEQPDDDQSKG